MLVEDEEGNESEDLVKLLKLQRDLSGVKERDKMSKSFITAVSALSDAVEDMAKAHKENPYYDKGLGESINVSMTKLSEALLEMAKDKIDLSPLTKSNEILAKNSDRNYQAVSAMMLDLQKQNQTIIDSIKSFKPEDNSGHIMAFMKSVSNTIVASNEAMTRAINSLLNKPEPTPPPVEEKKPKAFKHIVHYTRGKMDYVESIEVDHSTINK